MNGFSIDVSIPVLTVFFQGLLSFFSPCVLPMLPLYIGYLTGKKERSVLHMFCFCAGVSFAFFALGFGVSALGQFFRGNQTMFARIGGLFVILMGLYQLGVFGASDVLSKERRLPVAVDVLAMSPLTAFLLGFTFSFAWTPCVGPALAGVLMMAASAATRTKGFLLIAVYTAGFVIPFLLAGLFTDSVLRFMKKHGNMTRYTVKAGAVLMILMGFMMVTGTMNSVTGYLSEISAPRSAGTETAAVTETVEAGTETAAEDTETAAGEKEDGGPDHLFPAMDFTLYDQYGNSHTLSDYVGKTVFLNFWATWCPPCRRELPEIQTLYEEYQAMEDPDVVILGIAAPGYGSEQDEAGITKFLEENGYTYPVLMDRGGTVFSEYGITSFPTTYMIDADGNLFGYAVGQLSESMMRSIIEQTVTGVRVSAGE